MGPDFDFKDILRKKDLLPAVGASNFSLTVKDLKSEALKKVCAALQRNTQSKICYFLTLDSEPKWPYHQFKIEVFDNPHPEMFPAYFDSPLCMAVHETWISDELHRERLSIAIKCSVELRVKGQVRNGSNRVQFTQGQAVIDEIKKASVFSIGDDEPTLYLEALINPYVKDSKTKNAHKNDNKRK